MKRAAFLFPLCLLLCLLFCLPQAGCASVLKTAQIVSRADGRGGNLRSGEILTVQTSGFAPNATLEYAYQLLNEGEGMAAILSCPTASFSLNDGTGVVISTEAEDGSPCVGHAFFAVMERYGNEPASSEKLTVKVTMRDTNPKSSTCNDTVECKYTGFLPSDLKADMTKAGILLFEGEALPLTDALAAAGLVDAASETTVITPLTVGDESIFELSADGTLQACGRGSAYLELSVDRTNSPFHTGQKLESFRLVVSVLRKPEFSTVEEGVGVMAELIEPGVTYTVNGISLKTQNADSTMFFETGIPCTDQVCTLSYPFGGVQGKRDLIFHTETPGHVHDWTLSIGPDDTLHAVCNSTIGMLPHPDQSTKRETLTLGGPLKPIYSSVEKLAVLSRSTIGGIPVSQSEIVYYAGEEKLESAPIDTGRYTAKLTVDGIYTLSVPFEILKAEGNANVSIAGWKEGEEPNAPIPFSQTNGTDHVSYRYVKIGDDLSSGSPEPPTKAGEYLLMATFGEVQNYQEVTVRTEFSVTGNALVVLQNSESLATAGFIMLGMLFSIGLFFLLRRKPNR